MDSFWGNIFRRAERQTPTQALLRKIPIFERLNTRELTAIARIVYRREYDADEVIFRQGEPGVGMYIIESGVVSIIFETTGQLLADLGQGDFFGEISLLNETPRSATARAKTPCRLAGLFQPDLLDLVERNPRLGVKVLLALARIAGQRLVHSHEQLLTLHEEVEALQQHRPEHSEQESMETEVAEGPDGAKHFPVD